MDAPNARTNAAAAAGSATDAKRTATTDSKPAPSAKQGPAKQRTSKRRTSKPPKTARPAAKRRSRTVTKKKRSAAARRGPATTAGKRGKVAKRTRRTALRSEGRASGVRSGKVNANKARVGKKVRRGSRGNSTLPSLATVTLGQLQAELARRKSQLPRLEAKRRALIKEIATVDAKIASLAPAMIAVSSNGFVRSGGNAPPRSAIQQNGGKRGRRGSGIGGMSLVDALAKVLDGQTLSVPQMSEAVVKIGYRTASNNFRTVITNALGTNRARFRKVARGLYTLA